MTDEQKFDAIFRRWYGPLVGYSMGITLAAKAESEDLVQAVFARFWEQRAFTSMEFAEKPYLYRMVFNESISFLRKKNTRMAYRADRQRVEKDYADANPEVFDLQERVQQALGFMSTQCREVFELSRFEQLKYREIAQVMGISEKTVESHMAKALKIMRRELTDFLAIGIWLCLWA